MAIETLPFDPGQYLADEASQVELLVDALESGDVGYIAVALGTIACARGITKVANGDPQLSTLLGVTKALGVKLTAKAVAAV